MYSTAIQARSQTTLSKVKEHLRINGTTEDSTLKIYLAGAKCAADSYCSNRFLDDAGAERPIPAAVELWLLRKMSSLYNYREQGVSTFTVSGLGSVQLDAQDKRDLFPYWRPFI